MNKDRLMWHYLYAITRLLFLIISTVNHLLSTKKDDNVSD